MPTGQKGNKRRTERGIGFVRISKLTSPPYAAFVVFKVLTLQPRYQLIFPLHYDKHENWPIFILLRVFLNI